MVGFNVVAAFVAVTEVSSRGVCLGKPEEMQNPAPPRIHWAKPDLHEQDIAVLKQCLDSQWISQGPRVRTLEGLVASLCGRKHCVAVNSGSSALLASLISLDVTPGSDVVVPAMAFIALPTAVTLAGAVPLLADIDDTTGMITRETVAACLSENTRAVIGIDYGGFAHDWDDLHALCQEAGVPLIVDAASSFLSSNHARPAGAWGDVAILSFHSAKPITTGEGGAIVTDGDDIASRLRQVRNHGEVEGHKYCYQYLGGNLRMTDVAASLGISQLHRKDRILEQRHRVLHSYLESDLLREHAYCCHRAPEITSNGFTFSLVLHDLRDGLQQMLNERGIETRVMWPFCVDEQPVYQTRPLTVGGALEKARRFSRSCLSLPVHGGLSAKELDEIVSTCEKVLR